jgi:hypothetical protein
VKTDSEPTFTVSIDQFCISFDLLRRNGKIRQKQVSECNGTVALLLPVTAS